MAASVVLNQNRNQHMKRVHRSDPEYNELQKVKAENQKLRRQVSRLKKVISKFDLDQYMHVRELLEQHEDSPRLGLKNLKKNTEDKWQCHDCEEGILKIVILNRLDGTRYFRKCDQCGKKTKTKKYTEEVEE